MDNLDYPFEFDNCKYSIDELKSFIEYLNGKYREYLYVSEDGHFIPTMTIGIIKDDNIDKYYNQNNKDVINIISNVTSVIETFDYMYGFFSWKVNPLDPNAMFGITLNKENDMITRNLYFTRF